MIDADQRPGRFVLTGSQQFNVRGALNQSLAGRTPACLPFCQTVTRDYFQGLNRFAKVAGDRLSGGAVVYGGGKRQLRSDWEVWPVAELDRLAPRTFSFFAD
ncbi:MAG: hypothetical protein U5L00_12470 [Desulfovermiculus sp.]|nr:hypothetical protein [Desulfovermiculus sp.]